MMNGRVRDRMLRRRTLDGRRRSLEAYLARWLPAVIRHVGARDVAELLAGRTNTLAAMRLEAVAEETSETVVPPARRPTVLDAIVLAKIAAHVRHFLTPGQVRAYKCRRVGALYDGLQCRSRAWEN